MSEFAHAHPRGREGPRPNRMLAMVTPGGMCPVVYEYAVGTELYEERRARMALDSSRKLQEYEEVDTGDLCVVDVRRNELAPLPKAWRLTGTVTSCSVPAEAG